MAKKPVGYKKYKEMWAEIDKTSNAMSRKAKKDLNKLKREKTARKRKKEAERKKRLAAYEREQAAKKKLKQAISDTPVDESAKKFSVIFAIVILITLYSLIKKGFRFAGIVFIICIVIWIALTVFYKVFTASVDSTDDQYTADDYSKS